MKAIETIYHNYRFRSRLEARWAVFFDKLGVKYEYEKEGYDLEGEWYLPDFWIPVLDSFIEIKGEPSEEALSKAFWLSWCSGKLVYVITGSESLSGESSNVHAFGAFHIKLVGSDSARAEMIKDGFPDTIGGGIVKLKELCERFHINPLEKGLRSLPQVQADIANALPFPAEVYLAHHSLVWTECDMCNTFDLTPYGLLTQMKCGCFAKQPESIKQQAYKQVYCEEHGGIHNHRSKRLMAAYKAARQARFEHGERA